MASKTKWVMLRPGTVAHGINWNTRGQTVMFTEEDCKLRYYVEYAPTWGGGSPANNPPSPDWHVSHLGQSWLLEDSKNAIVSEVKIPSMKKEFVSAAVKGSVWEFERDWTFNGYQTSVVESNTEVYTVPAGTQVRIVDKKMRLAWYSPQEKCIVAEMSPGLEVFAMKDWGTDEIQAYIPAKEASQYLRLVTAGQRKVYWLVEDNDGKKILTKRYSNLSNVKASLRMRGGLIKYDHDSDDYDNQPPEWVADRDNEWGTASLPMDNGVWAAQYDHATDTLISREDMLEYMTMAKLSA